MISTPNALKSLFENYRRLRTESSSPRFSETKYFFAQWKLCFEAVRSQWANEATRFNVFSALGVADKELQHSAFLSFLLDPGAHHDQGTRFLSSFLDWLNLGGETGGTTVEGVRVVTELPIDELGRLDIAVFLGDGRIIAIENKVWADEQEDQIARYQRWLEQRIKKGMAEKGSQVVFLTLDGRSPQTHDLGSAIPVTCRSYRSLGEWIEGLRDLPTRIRVVCEMYSNLCTVLGRQA